MQEKKRKDLQNTSDARIPMAALEDELDAQEAEQLLRDFRESGEEGIPYEIVRKKTRLK